MAVNKTDKGTRGFVNKKPLYIGLGVLFLVLGYFGILMPGFPAIPFILLAAYFFANSSEKLHGWMLKQRLLAKLIRKSESKKGSLLFKLFVISQLWVSIIIAEWLFIDNIYYSAGLVVTGIIFSCVTYILMSK